MQLTFTSAEIDLLGRTADALTAWLGKPVIGEIVAEPEAAYEWALFAIPLVPGEDTEERPRVQVGGIGARFLGSRGGLSLADGQPLDCEFLWAIQLSDRAQGRFIKVDAQGDETNWSDTLTDLLPFELSDLPPPGEDDE